MWICTSACYRSLNPILHLSASVSSPPPPPPPNPSARHYRFGNGACSSGSPPPPTPPLNRLLHLFLPLIIIQHYGSVNVFCYCTKQCTNPRTFSHDQPHQQAFTLNPLQSCIALSVASGPQPPEGRGQAVSHKSRSVMPTSPHDYSVLTARSHFHFASSHRLVYTEGICLLTTKTAGRQSAVFRLSRRRSCGGVFLCVFHRRSGDVCVCVCVCVCVRVCVRPYVSARRAQPDPSARLISSFAHSLAVSSPVGVRLWATCPYCVCAHVVCSLDHWWKCFACQGR